MGMFVRRQANSFIPRMFHASRDYVVPMDVFAFVRIQKSFLHQLTVFFKFRHVLNYAVLRKAKKKRKQKVV